MTTSVVYPQGKARVTVAAAGSIAISSNADCAVYREIGYPNEPTKLSLLGYVNATTGMTTYGAYASGATIVIEAGASEAYYETGVAPVTQSPLYLGRPQPTPVALNATGSVTAASILGGIVTSTTAAAVAGTIPTGTVMDAASQFAVNDSIDWSVINTGGNTFTVTAATDHTIVGAGAVATATSGHFRTRKTASNTFVTYRMS